MCSQVTKVAWLVEMMRKKAGHNDMRWRSTKALQMEAGFFDITLAAIVSVQVCTQLLTAIWWPPQKQWETTAKEVKGERKNTVMDEAGRELVN